MIKTLAPTAGCADLHLRSPPESLTKGFTDTVDQLFGYRAWRDTKLAIVMFVREPDLTALIDKARDALAAHPQFIEWGETPQELELRAVVSWPGDERRRATLTVYLSSTPQFSGKS